MKSSYISEGQSQITLKNVTEDFKSTWGYLYDLTCNFCHVGTI